MNPNLKLKADEEIYEFTLSKEEELRVEVGIDENAQITVTSGTTEVEGAEIPLNYPQNFTNRRFAIYCWTEAKIKVQGNIQKPYTSARNKDAMTEYILSHYLINEMRHEALVANRIGPRVLITGSDYSGKSGLCHLLLNYSLKQGWTPLFVDLDLSNEICIPGSIAACVVDHIMPNEFLIDNALYFFHGYGNNEVNIYLYEKQITELALTVNAKLLHEMNQFKKKFEISSEVFISNEHPTLFASGMIVHCPLLKTNLDKQMYKNILEQFDIDLVLVVENEKLNNDFKTIIDKLKRNTAVCLLSKSKGISQDNSYKEKNEQKRFDSYFKGPFNNLKITELKLDLNRYKLIQIAISNVSSNILPIGQSSDLNLILKEVNNEENIVNKIIAIPHLDEKTIAELELKFEKSPNSYVDLFAKVPVASFGYITKHDKKANVVNICSPRSELPHKYIIVGTIKYANF